MGKCFLLVDFNLFGWDNVVWLEIIYLDEDLCISCGNEGNVFILVKV